MHRLHSSVAAIAALGITMVSAGGEPPAGVSLGGDQPTRAAVTPKERDTAGAEPVVVDSDAPTRFAGAGAAYAQRFDRNEDGRLDAGEREKLREDFPKYAAAFRQLLDDDRDGFVGHEDWARWTAKTADRLGGPAVDAESPAEVARKRDAAEAEASAADRSEAHAAAFDAFRRSVDRGYIARVMRLDRDGDGDLSDTELARFSTSRNGFAMSRLVRHRAEPRRLGHAGALAMPNEARASATSKDD